MKKATLAKFTVLLISSLFWRCESKEEAVFANYSTIQIDSTASSQNEITKMIAPYRDSLEVEMNRVIGFAKDALIKNRPEGGLNNFVVDVSLAALENELNPALPHICLMNYGGLRSSINKGNITIGDIYKLMPFDNTMVILKFPVSIMDSIVEYMDKSGGEPIAGVKIQKGKFYFEEKYENTDTIQILTTNYLANGNDNMSFLKNSYERKNTPILLRDVLIQEVEKQDTIKPLLDKRIEF